MKKLLLGSTALVAGGLMAAPAMAADPVKMGVGGYYTFYAGGGQIDSIYNLSTGAHMQFRGFNFIQEGEIHFTGQTKLDNGTTVGLTVEFEANSSSTAGGGGAGVIDEAFLFAFGDWGRVEFGSRDSAGYRMYYGSPSALIGWGWFQHNHQWNAVGPAFNKAYRGGIATTITPQWQDVNRINLFTPRFAGIQVGVGYAPKINVARGGAAGAAVCGFAGSMNVGFCQTNDFQYHDAVDIGVNYLNKFGDVTVALYASYAYATFVPGFTVNNASGNAATGANLANWHQMVFGAQFGFGGFTIGGAVGWDNNGLGRNYYTHVDNDTRFYTAAIMYATGPWQVSAGWAGFRNTNGDGTAPVGALSVAGGIAANAAATSATAFGQNIATGALAFGPENVDKFEVGANYALAPGVKMTGGFMYYSVTAPGTNPIAAGNSWVVLLGMDFRF